MAGGSYVRLLLSVGSLFPLDLLSSRGCSYVRVGVFSGSVLAGVSGVSVVLRRDDGVPPLFEGLSYSLTGSFEGSGVSVPLP